MAPKMLVFFSQPESIFAPHSHRSLQTPSDVMYCVHVYIRLFKHDESFRSSATVCVDGDFSVVSGDAT